MGKRAYVARDKKWLGNKMTLHRAATRSRDLFIATALTLTLLSACGGHHHGGDDGGTTSGETTGGTTGTTTGGETTGGTTGGETTGGTTGGETTGGTATSCDQLYTPELAAQDKTNGTTACKPLAGTICPTGDANLLQRTPIACDGVTYEEHTASTSAYTSTYFTLTGTNTKYEAIYLGLHYLLANKGAFTNIVRLQELAKARKVLVVAPQAPSITPLITTSRWPSGSLLDSSTVAPTIAWLQEVISEVRTQYKVDASVPVYVAGLSNGAAMAYLYACTDPQVTAVLVVASEANSTSLTTTCTSAHTLGSVIVHGTSDPETPYDGNVLLARMSIPDIHTHFSEMDGCDATDASTSVPLYNDSLQVTISYTPADKCVYRNFLVTVNGGGHNWPGTDRDFVVSGILYGDHTSNFDATLQGYDLLKQAAGDD